MSSLVILLIALIAVTGSSNKVESSPAQAIDLSGVLELVKQQRLNMGPSKQRKLRLRIVSSDSDSGSDDSSTDLENSDHSDINRLARLRTDRIVDLIETVAKEKQKNIRITNRKGKQNNGQTSYLFHNENYDNIQSSNNNLQKQVLEKLFTQLSNDEEQQIKPKKRLIPNRLTPTVTMDDVYKYYEKKNTKDEITGLEDYSKVYIVLNPQAVKNSKNKNSLNDLISKVLSLSSPTSERDPQYKSLPRRHKGFVLNENHSKRRFKGINNKIPRMGDDEKKLAPSGRITAMPI